MVGVIGDGVEPPPPPQPLGGIAITRIAIQQGKRDFILCNDRHEIAKTSEAIATYTCATSGASQ
jgi:hypothetical protein